MIEHVSIPESEYKKANHLYEKTLTPVGYKLERDYGPEAAGFSEGESTSIWIAARKGPVQPIHVALRAGSKEAVQKFYEEGLKAGGTDNGKPDFRTDYGPNYYAAFLLDPDGNNIEACYFGEKAPGT